MRYIIDETAGELRMEADGETTIANPLYSDDAFRALAKIYLKIGWNQRYSYTFSWLGRPVIQLPEDMIRVQEVIHAVKPDVIIETGVAHGGSLIFYASLCAAMGKGRVIGIDIEIRPHNRAAIEAHALSGAVTLVDGSSTAPEVLERVRGLVKPGETVLVILDSNHSYQHVLDELRLYSPLVTKGSYIIATDGVMRDLADVPRGQPGWATDNPARAALDFARETQDFRPAPPEPVFAEGAVLAGYTYWPDAYLKRIA